MKETHQSALGSTAYYPDDCPISPSGHHIGIGPSSFWPFLHLTLYHAGAHMVEFLTAEDARAIGWALIDKADQLEQQQAAAHDTEYADPTPDRYTVEDDPDLAAEED